MNIKLLAEHNSEFLSLKGGCKAPLCLHLSKHHIVGNHMSRLIFPPPQCSQCYSLSHKDMSGDLRKSTNMAVPHEKTQISLGISSFNQSLRCLHEESLGP